MRSGWSGDVDLDRVTKNSVDQSVIEEQANNAVSIR
jgi:hypothetical protein